MRTAAAELFFLIPRLANDVQRWCSSHISDTTIINPGRHCVMWPQGIRSQRLCSLAATAAAQLFHYVETCNSQRETGGTVRVSQLTIPLLKLQGNQCANKLERVHLATLHVLVGSVLLLSSSVVAHEESRLWHLCLSVQRDGNR